LLVRGGVTQLRQLLQLREQPRRPFV